MDEQVEINAAQSPQPVEDGLISDVGAARVYLKVDAPPGTRVRITIETETNGSPGVQARSYQALNNLVSTLPAARPLRLPSVRLNSLPLPRWNAATWFFVTGCAVYMLVRLIGLPNFPIYFFTDEAVQTVLAQDFIRDGLRGYDKILLPTYFFNSYQYNLGVSVYLQVIPYLLFGKSVWVTRGVSVLVSLLAAVGVGLTVKNIFRSAYAGLAVLLLSMMPAWFLHSRTAFETSIATSFFAMFLYCYLLYRSGQPRALYAAVGFGALTFYSYSPIRMVVGVLSILLLFSDARYHWQNRKVVLPALGLTLLAGLPLLRFQLAHPVENLQHLVQLNSYWIQDLTLAEKLARYGQEYLRGLNPAYWFFYNTHDIVRHLMKGYGFLLTPMLVFFAAGLWAALRNIRSSAHRAVLAAYLAVPTGAALVEHGVTRELCMVIPATLLIFLGLFEAIRLVQQNWPVLRSAAAPLLFVMFAGYNVFMLNDALTNGPLWYRDYGLSGLQYGSNQLFPAVDAYLTDHPDERLIVSPSWANGTNTIARFYYPGDPPFEMGSIDGHFNHRQPLDEHTLFVMIPEEYQRMLESGKFTDIHIEKTLFYPDGEPGFYFVHLQYVENIDQILLDEQEQRRVLLIERVKIGDLNVKVEYPYLDMGTIDDVFDGDRNSLIRTLEANPLRMILNFPVQRSLSGCDVLVGGTATRVNLRLEDSAGVLLLEQEQTVKEAANPRDVAFDWEKSLPVSRLLIEVDSIHDGEPAHVHLWEVNLK